MKAIYARLVCYALPACLALSACSTPPKEQAEEKKVAQVNGPEDIENLIKEMTLDEKLGMIHASSSFTSGGVERLGIPEWTMSDGPHGVRKEHGRDWVPDEGAEDSVSYLPVGVTLAATWNPERGYAAGTVLGSEANYRGKDVILGPGVNIIRTPLNGRNFEYLSEDPYLASRMAVGYIKGVQDQGIAACVKHFAANNQETDRNTIDVEMSERALREIYLPAFKAAVREGGVFTLMGAYNQFRGQFCTHNEYLINDILKDEWGFGGAVISDWGAVHDTRQALLYGTDVEMGTDLSMLPNPDYDKFFLARPARQMIEQEAVDIGVVNEKVRRILTVMYKTHMFGGRPKGAINTPEHQQSALKIAEEGIVLLKNDKVLPFEKSSVKKIAVIGANADRKQAGGGGSSQVNAKYEITPLAGIKSLVGDGANVSYAPGYTIARDAGADKKLIDEAVALAKDADAVVYVGGWIHGYSDAWNDNAFDAEGVDKADMTMPFGQDAVIAALLKANPKTVVVLMGGGAIDMSKSVRYANAIIWAGYPGMEGGHALAEILFGDINPSGKLPFTFPKKLEDVAAHSIGQYPGQDGKVIYKDDIFVGYRHFDTHHIAPEFPFGHGLSYTKFAYTDLVASASGDGVTVHVTLTNTGDVGGSEVVQVYVKDDVSSVTRPSKELKGFEKVSLEAGESRTVEIKLPRGAFEFYSEQEKNFTLEPGSFTIMVGSSSGDIRETASVSL